MFDDTMLEILLRGITTVGWVFFKKWPNLSDEEGPFYLQEARLISWRLVIVRKVGYWVGVSPELFWKRCLGGEGCEGGSWSEWNVATDDMRVLIDLILRTKTTSKVHVVVRAWLWSLKPPCNSDFFGLLRSNQSPLRHRSSCNAWRVRGRGAWRWWMSEVRYWHFVRNALCLGIRFEKYSSGGNRDGDRSGGGSKWDVYMDGSGLEKSASGGFIAFRGTGLVGCGCWSCWGRWRCRCCNKNSRKNCIR